MKKNDNNKIKELSTLEIYHVASLGTIHFQKQSLKKKKN